MSKLKTTIKASELGDAPKRQVHPSDPYGFVFSNNQLDWIFSKTDHGKKKRKQYESQNNVQRAA